MNIDHATYAVALRMPDTYPGYSTMKVELPNGLWFTDEDIVDLDDWIPDGQYNPHDVHPWLLHDHGFPVAVAFAACVQDAMDAAADAGKIDRYMITDADRADYDEDDERIAYLGNAGEPFDLESLSVVELPNPPRSFVAQFNVHMAGSPQAS